MRFAFILAFIFSINVSHAQYAETRYPIVMVSGAGSFDTVDLGITEIDYWYGITEALRDAGAEVYVTNLSSLQSNELRADELIDDLMTILSAPNIEKVNLIAHSQGALAARYAAYVLQDKIASVTTVAGMNRGTHVSPWARLAAESRGITPGSPLEKVLEIFIGVLFTGFEVITTPGTDGDFNSDRRKWQSLVAVEAATAPANIEVFNQRYPAGLPDSNCMSINNGGRKDVEESANHLVNDIHYFSIGATSNARASSPWENLDAIHWSVTKLLDSTIISDNDPEYQWDGLVPQCGQKLGKYIGGFFMSHFDAIGHFAGIAPTFVKNIYTTHANRLKQIGL